MPTDVREPEGQFDRPVVWITGSSRGIGRAIALAFGARHWRVAVHYHEREADAHQVVESIQQRGGEAQAFQGDVRNGGQMSNIAAAIVDQWVRLDVAVCNAGIATSRLLAKTQPTDWTRSIDANLTGAFHTLRAAATVMTAAGCGHILVVGSHAGFQGHAGQAAYAASKAGLLGLMRSAAREWGHADVRVNMILPGWQPTELAGHAFPNILGDDHVLHRTVDIDEVARTIVHLAGCRDVSGQVWNLDSRPL